jgi:hypothetical protein
MAQVVDSTNIEQYITTGKVDAFKAPEVSRETTDEQGKKDDKTTEKIDDKAEKSEDDDSDLPERVRQQIGKKHRAMKEAEEFAEREYNQRRAAEKRADAEEAEKNALKAKLAEYEQKSRPAIEVVKDEPYPQQSDFETVQEYIAACVKHDVKAERAREKAAAEQQRIADQAAQVRTDFANRLQSFMKETPDFEAVTSAADIELPTAIIQYILESKKGPQIGYALSKLHASDPTELNRVLNLSPILAIEEIGQLVTNLAKPAPKKAEQQQVVSRAPAPITPIDGKTAPVNPDLNRNMTYAEYKALKAQQKGKG